MKLTLLRTRLLPTKTTGQLYIEGDLFCFTLEDKVREQIGVPVEKWKIAGETAIPSGKYQLDFVNSPRFGPDSVAVLRVPGFKHILIHGGNTEANTEGCILVGYKLTDNYDIKGGTSRPALADLKHRLKGESEIWLTIQTPGLLTA